MKAAPERYRGLVNCELTPRAMTVTEDSYRSPTTRVPAHSPTSSCNTWLLTRDTWLHTPRDTHSAAQQRSQLKIFRVSTNNLQNHESWGIVQSSHFLIGLDFFAKPKVFSDVVCRMTVNSDTHRPAQSILRKQENIYFRIKGCDTSQN